MADRLDDKMRGFIEGMSVSVDVSTGEHDAQHRYFGTVTEVMDDRTDKHGVTLLVHDAKPNFTPVDLRAVRQKLESAHRNLELATGPAGAKAALREIDAAIRLIDTHGDQGKAQQAPVGRATPE